MGRVIKGNVLISEIVIDNDLYPRVGIFWQNTYKYSQAISAGAKFPVIVLANHRGKKILVDGRHRMEAHKLLKNKEVEAEIHFGWSRAKIFEESIKRNVSHGLTLSPYEIRKLILKLRLMKYKDSHISGLVNVPLGKLEKFVAVRAVSAITGNIIGGVPETQQMIIKSPLKHLAGGEYSLEQIQLMENSQEFISGKGQVNLLEQVVTLMENNLLDSKNQRVQKLIDEIKLLIKKL